MRINLISACKKTRSVFKTTARPRLMPTHGMLRHTSMPVHGVIRHTNVQRKKAQCTDVDEHFLYKPASEAGLTQRWALS